MHQTNIEMKEAPSASVPITDDQMVEILRGHFADERLYALDLTPTIRFILQRWLRLVRAETLIGES